MEHLFYNGDNDTLDINLSFGNTLGNPTGQKVSDILTFDMSTYNLTDRVYNDISLYNKLKTSLSQDRETQSDIKELSKNRLIKSNVLSNKGIFYSRNIIDTMNRFEELRESSLGLITNSSFEERYMLPICLPNGDIFTYLGYDPFPEGRTKYEIPNLKWVNQSNLIGNLDSIEKYGGTNKLIFVVEGYFDALVINSQWRQRSVCIFGNRLSSKQKSILYLFKQQGYQLIYIPDIDTAGEKISKNPYWDKVWNIPNRNSNIQVKDISDYVYSYLIEYHSSGTPDNTKGFSVDNIDINIPFYSNLDDTRFDTIKLF